MRTRPSSKSQITASSATFSKSCPRLRKHWKKRKPHSLLQFQSRSLCYNESKSMTVQREQLEADVLIVGAGPAGVAGALHLANLVKKDDAAGGGTAIFSEKVFCFGNRRGNWAHNVFWARL